MIIRRGLPALVITSLVLLGACLPACVPGCGDGGQAASQQESAKRRLVTIGTGGVTGVYYPTGGAIAKLVNRKRDQYGVRMSVESTGGSVFNINAVLSGDMEFGIAQSDRQYQAVKGLAEWKGRGPQEKLRAICSLYPELVTLVAAEDAGIDSLADLKGKRVSLCNPGSGARGNALDVLRTAGLDWRNDIHAEGLKATEQAGMLQDGRIDAFFYTVGHPNGSITEATAGQRRKVRFVSITGMDKLIEQCPYYAEGVIAIKLYTSAVNTGDVPTIGVMTTLVTSAAVPEEVVYAVAKELFDNLDEFKKTHPAFERLTRQGMLAGLSAPIHPGAERYFRETGLAE